MYAWIWRKLPFGLWGKLTGSVLMIGAVSLVLWMFVFPAVEPMLTPFDDVQVGDPNSGYSDVSDPSGVTPSTNPGDHEIPYETTEPTISPSPSKRR
ncbi:hypothetical protein [Catelliglobosispora koreensis]|uniref:hypothetical protein n=1 Tax=Catelliglobosispora koreensis TaxID=129052 RepID=UPI0003648901|nr:hypothetical protein [Catelliglobosispora koreensis]